MVKKYSVPRGTMDILPDQIDDWVNVELQARRILNIYNYKEIRTPIFEETGLFTRSMGQTSDVVQKQMLNLASQRKDENGNIKLSGLSLRPENTASIVRSYIENNFDKKESISKFFYIGPMFRGERPQKGRLRQFHQIGVEVIGPGALQKYLDAEVIILSVEILKALGIKDFSLKINTLGSIKDKEVFSKTLRKNLKEKLNFLCDDCQDRFDRNVFRILDCKNKSCQGIIDELIVDDSYLSNKSKEWFEDVKETLDANGIKYEVSPKLVRGLDYYNETVFEISHLGLGSQDALGAGGRYNNLVEYLGGNNKAEAGMGAIGFSLGIERILLAQSKIKKGATSNLEAYIIALDNNIAYKKAFNLLYFLRKQDVSSDMNYQGGSIKSQMRAANKSKARYTLIIGEDEVKNKKVTIKNMESGEEKQIPSDKIKNFIKL